MGPWAQSLVWLCVQASYALCVPEFSHLYVGVKVVGQGRWIQQCLNSLRDLFEILSPSLSFLLCFSSFLTHSFIHKCSQNISSGPRSKLGDTWEWEMIQTHSLPLGNSQSVREGEMCKKTVVIQPLDLEPLGGSYSAQVGSVQGWGGWGGGGRESGKHQGTSPLQ